MRFLRLFALAIAIAGLIAMTAARIPATQATDTVAETAHEATITPNENLVLDGLPPIPQRIADSTEHYTEFRAAGLRSWHPTRREMLISTRFGDTAQVHQVQFPLGSRKQLTFFTERVSGATYQPTTGDYFVFSKDIGGNEFAQNYRYDLATSKVTLLTDGQSKNTRGIWSPAGDRMAYTSTRRNGQDWDLYMIDPLDPSSDRLLSQSEGAGWFPLDWSPDGRTILEKEYRSVTESYLWLVDVATGEKKRLTEPAEGEPIAYDSAVFSQDGRGVYLTSDRASEFQTLAYLDLATGETHPLTEDINWDVESLALSDDGRHLAFTVNEAGASVLRILDTATEIELNLPELPVGLIYGLNWHLNNQDLGFTRMSAQATADAYSLNLASGEIQRWTESETGGLNTDAFTDPELVTWNSFDGKPISGFLYRPPADKFPGPRPVMVSIHGGPEGQARPFFLGRNNYYLNELGVALLYPNVRGSSGFGKTFLQLDNGYLREDSVKDIGALLDWIGQQDDLNSDRILVTGGSYGGYMSLAVATHYSDRIRAAIDIVGISNFVSFLENTEAYRRDLRRVEYGDERDPAMREFLLRISPVNNADNITVPLFVVHGQNDPRVPVSEAEQIVRTLQGNDTHVWYLLAKDEGHGFAKKQNSDFLFYATVKFIETYLLE
ncbi:MAG: alpha/beta fold hydrolase [Cyanobacteria bacterium P01_A01_bin.123]